MVGRSLESRFPDRTPQHRRGVLRGARTGPCGTRRSPSAWSCKNSSFIVRRGEIVGFAGLMGAGRTELAMSIFGRSYGNYVSGQIFKDGKEIAAAQRRGGDRPRPRLRQRGPQGARPQPARRHQALHRVGQAHARSPRAGVVDEVKEYEAAEEYRKSCASRRRRVDEGVNKLSGGNQQKVVLAKWMFTDPDLLILDEPTRGIDVGAKYEIYGIIQQTSRPRARASSSSRRSCPSCSASPTASTRSSRARSPTTSPPRRPTPRP